MPDLRAYARETAIRAGCDPDVFVRQIQQESGFNPAAFNAGSGATGVAQIIKRWHPDVDPTDPIASLDYAATWMAQLHAQYGSYQRALAAYNWGPGNLAGWDGQRATLPGETRHYLDVILGDGWPEPANNGAAHNGAVHPTPGHSDLGSHDGGATGNHAGTSVDAVLHVRVARVAPDTLNLRAEPSLSAVAVTQLPDGTLLLPLGPARVADDVTWVQVRAAGGAQGWMSAKYLDMVAAVPAGVQPAPAPMPEPVPAPVQLPRVAQYRLTESGVRLRERPGTGPLATVLTTLTTGTVVDDDGAETVQADGFVWRRIRARGRTGWTAIEFLAPLTTVAPPRPHGDGMHSRFDAATAAELQLQDWTCSIRSTMWLLSSIGIRVTPAEAQDAMSPRYCNSNVGLLNASGAGIVEVLRDTWGVAAFNVDPVSFDEVAGWAGRCPVAIGGRNWGGPGFGHWSAVRGVTADGALMLANPARGQTFGQQTLNRDQWARMGSFSAVIIPCE